jgi:hypothetical protein
VATHPGPLVTFENQKPPDHEITTKPRRSHDGRPLWVDQLPPPGTVAVHSAEYFARLGTQVGTASVPGPASASQKEPFDENGLPDPRPVHSPQPRIPQPRREEARCEVSTEPVLTLVTKDWLRTSILDFDADAVNSARVVAAVDPDGTGLRVLKHVGYRVPFRMMGAKVEDLEHRATKTLYRLPSGEQWRYDAADVLDGLPVGAAYVTAPFRGVLVQAMATAAAAAAIEAFLDDVYERCGEEIADIIEPGLDREELGTVLAEWFKSKLKVDLLVPAGQETTHTVQAKDMVGDPALTCGVPAGVTNAIWLIRTHGMDVVREWVFLVRRDAIEIDRLAMAHVNDPLSVDRQRFRAGLRWLAETPDVEWEGLGAEGRQS